jgi:hypothetical protein
MMWAVDAVAIGFQSGRGAGLAQLGVVRAEAGAVEQAGRRQRGWAACGRVPRCRESRFGVLQAGWPSGSPNPGLLSEWGQPREEFPARRSYLRARAWLRPDKSRYWVLSGSA